MKKEILDQFEGKTNVCHIISDNGSENWLSQPISFADETWAKGACKLNTVENETKHVLFLFNDKNEEVGRYYIGKKLQGKTPEQIVELKDQLCFFESWNPTIQKWVPCVGIKILMHTDTVYINKQEQRKEVFSFDKINSTNPDKLNSEIIKSEFLDTFKGKERVEHIVYENGIENWNTLCIKFKKVFNDTGANKIKTIETDKLHALFLFDESNVEVGRYYMCKNLQGETPEKIDEIKDDIYCFETWNPQTKTWVPCIKLLDTFKATIEMYNKEIADQEERDLLEYGTTDERKIEQIKKEKNDNRNLLIFIIFLGVIMYMIMGGVARCTGSKFDPFEDNDTEWQYKHTDRL